MGAVIVAKTKVMATQRRICGARSRSRSVAISS